MATRSTMPKPDDEFEEGESDDPGDRDDPDPSDMDDEDDDGPDLVPCPYCRAEIAEVAEVCPHCGSFISSEDAPRRRPAWLVAGVAVALLAVVVAWVMMSR
jgi:zinc-ribbon domain